MPWQRWSPWSSVSNSSTMLCAGWCPSPSSVPRYGISRKTGYKFLARYEPRGPQASPIGRAAHTARRGARSGVAPAPAQGPSAPSVLGAAEAAPPRAASAGPRRPGRCAPPSRAASSTWASSPPADASAAGPAGPPRAPMERARMPCWTTDYKGQFQPGDGQYCFPLTVADGVQSPALGLSGPHQHQAGRGPARLRAPVPRVRPARSASAPITGSPSPPRRSGASPRSPSGGSGSGSSPISSSPAPRSRTAATSACISPSSASAPGPLAHDRGQQQRCFDRWRQEYNTAAPARGARRRDARPRATPPLPGPIPRSSPRWSIPATTRSAA